MQPSKSKQWGQLFVRLWTLSAASRSPSLLSCCFEFGFLNSKLILVFERRENFEEFDLML